MIPFIFLPWPVLVRSAPDYRLFWYQVLFSFMRSMLTKTPSATPLRAGQCCSDRPGAESNQFRRLKAGMMINQFMRLTVMAEEPRGVIPVVVMVVMAVLADQAVMTDGKKQENSLCH
ncbi:MAG: hypothetical protein WBB23_05575 [Desulforhopalus sp.]